tara:strand:+ start:2597 stop:2707 length:111 start_codon:yes stop_codon:yes gene_type:complete
MNDFLENFEMWLFLFLMAMFTSIAIEFLIKTIYRSL